MADVWGCTSPSQHSGAGLDEPPIALHLGIAASHAATRWRRYFNFKIFLDAANRST